MSQDARRDVSADRLERLRGDLAALRARTAAELGVAAPAVEPTPSPTRRATSAPATSTPDSSTPDSSTPATGRRAADPDDGTTAGRRPRSPRPSRAPRPPRPPRRGPLPTLARWRRRPPARLAVPAPVPVRRRPGYLAAPRWPIWTASRAAAAIAVGLPVALQLAHRLSRAMVETSVLLGATPTRTDFLRAAGGVAGGGLTAALAVAALAVVRGRPGYLAGAAGLLGLFVALPWMAYTRTAGIVTASTPTLQEVLAPQGWAGGGALTAVFWLAALALLAALVDLGLRSARALGRALGR
jgi:hypothetical protein